jgi:murein DD-endopeptidase
MKRHFGFLLTISALLAVAGCSPVRTISRPDSVPVVVAAPPAAPQQIGRGERIAQIARSQLGAPYRFGGADPLGFDCSGLVRYVFGREGILVPRTAAAQLQAVQPLELAELQPGDLLFYRSGSGPVDHVAIYVGDGLMVHAPRTGRVVEQRRLEDSWYVQRFISAGRIVTEL